MISAAGTFPSRRARALDRARREGFAGLLVSGRANVAWATGFTGSNGWLLLAANRDPVLVTDARYREQAARQSPDVEVRIAERGLVEALDAPVTGLGSVAFESDQLSHAAAVELVERRTEVAWGPLREVLAPLRAIKDAGEVERQRRALALAERVLLEVAASTGANETEAGLAARLEFECKRRGAAGMAFETIVAGGAHGALPHARPRNVPLPEGVPIVVDLGCVVEGYCSDITRCLVRGSLREPWRARLESVSAARAAAIEAIRPGMAAREVDAVARAVLAEAGLADAFVHSLGHGVGLEVHESPRLAATSDDVLVAGMVVTVEPGVYLPDRGGVRLEDMVVVTESGAERLNSLPDAPIRLGARVGD